MYWLQYNGRMKKRDNIEQSFGEKFHPSSVQSEGWNEPSDSVWDDIAKELYSERKNKFGFLPFLMMSLLSMSLIFSAYMYYQNIELKQNLKEASSSTMIIPDQKDISKEVVVTSTDYHNESNTTNAQGSTAPIDDKRKSFVENTLSKSLDNVSYAAPHIPSNLSDYRTQGQNISLTYVTKPASKPENKIKSTDSNDIINQPETRETNSVPYLHQRMIDYLIHNQEDILIKEVIISKPQNDRRPTISFLPNVAAGILKTSGIQETALTELIDKEYGNTAYGFDFMFSLPLSKSLDVTVGAGIESFQFATEYDITLPYNTEDESIDGESGYIDFEHSLPTAFGNTDTALRLSRKRATGVLNESNVDLDFNTNHNFVSISLPVGINYRFGGEKSFFNVGLIARPTYIVNAHSNIRSVFSHHSEIDAVNNLSVSTYGDIRKLNVSVGLNIGYHLYLSEYGGLNANIGYHDYMFDFYQSEGFSSSVRKMGFSVGYFHTL